MSIAPAAEGREHLTADLIEGGSLDPVRPPRLMLRGAVLGVAGTLVVVLAVVAFEAATRPALTSADRAYCAGHAQLIAEMWTRRGAPGDVVPADEVSRIAGYYQGDRGAIVLLAAHSYANDFPGEVAPTDRIDAALGDACRALTHP